MMLRNVINFCSKLYYKEGRFLETIICSKNIPNNHYIEKGKFIEKFHLDT